MLKGNLTCETIGKIITYYVEEKLDKKTTTMVSLHLRNCPLCMEKYTLVKKLYNEVEQRNNRIKEVNMMKELISAYLDNEMTNEEMTEFEKKLAQKPEYENDLIDVLRLKKTLNNAFYKTKYKINVNLAPKIIEELKESRKVKNRIIDFFKIFFQ